MAFNIFQNSQKTVPRSDSQVIRVNMQEIEIGGRKSALPAADAGATQMAIRHVSTGGK